MDHFPVVSSILSGTSLAALLKQHYALPPTTTCSLIKAGVNHSYLVVDGQQQYVLRVYSSNWRLRNEIVEELRLLNHLLGHGIAVSAAITDKTGQSIQQIQAPEGLRFAVLFSYAAGEKQFTFSMDTHVEIGKIMGGMHLATEGFTLARTNYDPHALLVDSLRQLAAFLPASAEEMKWMQATQQFLIKELENVDKSKLRTGAVHLDIWFDNLHIDEHNNITIFDFDFCGNGWLCLDVAYYLMQLQVLEPDESVYHTKAAAFLNGYESRVALSDEERRILPLLSVSLYFFYLGVQCRRFEDWSNVFINETYLKRYITMRVKKLSDFHQLNA